MRRLPLPRISWIVASLTVTLSAALAADEPPTSLFGVIQKVEEEGDLIRIKSKAGKFLVAVDKSAKITRHEVVALSDVELGTHVFVLGRHTEATPGSHGGQHPPTMTSILAIVAVPAKAYVPPPVSPKLRQRHVEWKSGTLQTNDRGLYFGRISLAVGGGQPVIVWKPGTKADLAKSQQVLMWGRSKIDDPKNKKFRADEIVLMSPAVKEKLTYPAVLDFTGAVRPNGAAGTDAKGKSKKKKKKDDKPDF